MYIKPGRMDGKEEKVSFRFLTKGEICWDEECIS